MGLTILEASKRITEPRQLAVIMELAEDDLLKVQPFKNVTGGGTFYNQEVELPGVGWRGINEGLDASVGIYNPMAEPLKIFGGDVNVDRFILDTQGREQRGTQVQAKVRAMRASYADSFVNGGLSRAGEPIDPREMDGLKKRINTSSSQYLVNTSNNGGLSLAALDELIDAVESGGAPKYVYMPKAVRRAISSAARNPALGGNIQFMKDEFGYQFVQYGEARIITSDVNDRNQPIQPFNEGADADTTSVYCVAFGDDLCTGIQGSVDGVYGISVRDLGESHQAPSMISRVEWYIGMAVYHGRSAARLANVGKGAAEA